MSYYMTNVIISPTLYEKKRIVLNKFIVKSIKLCSKWQKRK